MIRQDVGAESPGAVLHGMPHAGPAAPMEISDAAAPFGDDVQEKRAVPGVPDQLPVGRAPEVPMIGAQLQLHIHTRDRELHIAGLPVRGNVPDRLQYRLKCGFDRGFNVENGFVIWGSHEVKMPG